LKKYAIKSLAIAAFLLPVFGSLRAQSDSREIATENSIRDSSRVRDPHKATILALCLPGSGQIYNRKYWKVPLVYGAMGTAAVFLIHNRSQVRNINEELRYRTANPGNVSNAKYAVYPTQSLIGLRNDFKNYRDFSILALTAAYGLQVVDAVVDAHLSGFDMNQSISIKVRPTLAPVAGLGLKFVF
jgi:hypothetical protein